MDGASEEATAAPATASEPCRSSRRVGPDEAGAACNSGVESGKFGMNFLVWLKVLDEKENAPCFAESISNPMQTHLN
jgi:hypothetical protein